MSGLHAINPNQFAIPGMEHLAHPFAEHLAHGLMVKYRHGEEGGSERDQHILMAHEPGEMHPDLYYHSILQWNDKRPSHGFPGEVQWVESGNAYGQRTSHRGVPRSLFKLAHEVDLGQDTVPVHSPVRTDAGEAFSHKVMPHLAGPRLKDDDLGMFKAHNKAARSWRPPPGIHPYEQEVQQKLAEDKERHVNMRRQLNTQPRLTGWEGAQ